MSTLAKYQYCDYVIDIMQQSQELSI